MSRLTTEGKVGIAVVAVLTIAFSIFLTNNAQAQASRTGRPDVVIQTTVATSTDFSKSSVYITGASGRDYITPFAGFGVSMLPDSCFAYANIASDVRTITNLLSLQMKQVMESYYNASCNTQSTSTPACSNYLDTINNLALSYATYQVEGLKQASEKTRLCNTNNTRKTGVSPRTYYEIDVVALTYASVRDAYVGNKFRYYTTLINNVNKNLTSKMNVAIRSGKFTDKPTASSSLRTLARNTLNGNPNVAETRSRVIPPPATTNLTNPNAFLFFGQTDNVADKTIAAIPMNSLQEYASLFNANPARFGDVYNKVNSSLLDAGSAILMNINKKIDLRLPPREVLPEPVAVATTTETIPAATQKASVINSIGNWFGGIWGAISDFFGYMFWGEEVGAAITGTSMPTSKVILTGGAVPVPAASGSGASGSGESFDEKLYKQLCPALPNPVPKLMLTSRFVDKGEVKYPGLVGMSIVGYEDLRVISPYTTETDLKIDVEYSGVPMFLTPAQKQYYINVAYNSKNNANNNKTGKEIPSKGKEDLIEWHEKMRTWEKKTVFDNSHELSRPSSPYDCLRSRDHVFNTWYHYSDSVKITLNFIVENGKQTASGTVSLRPEMEDSVAENFAQVATEANNIHMKYENERKNKANK